MVAITGLVLTAAAALAATFGLIVTYLNYRARVQNELPEINIYYSDIHKGNICINFKMVPDPKSIRWEVIRVAVDKSLGSRCQLSPPMQGSIEWRDCYEYDQPIRKGELLISRTGSEVWLLFACRTPLRWWKRWQWWRHWEERALLPVYYNPLRAFPLTMSSEK